MLNIITFCMLPVYLYITIYKMTKKGIDIPNLIGENLDSDDIDEKAARDITKLEFDCISSNIFSLVQIILPVTIIETINIFSNYFLEIRNTILIFRYEILIFLIVTFVISIRSKFYLEYKAKDMILDILFSAIVIIVGTIIRLTFKLY